VGIIAALAAVGAGVGLVLAGPIITHLNYHWLFWIPLIMVVIAGIFAKVFVPESPVRTPGGISWAAALLLSGWLVALLLGVSEAPSWGWDSPRVLGLLAIAAVLFVSWVAVEVRTSQPLVDMHMMRIPAVWTNNLVAFLFGVGMYSAMAFLPEFLQTPPSAGYGFGASIVQSGIFLLPLSVTMFAAGLLSGRIAARVGSKSAVIVGSILSCIAYLVLAFAHSQEWEIYTASALLGLGLGLAFSAMSNLIVQAVPHSQTGVASGMNANIRTIGGALGAAVMSSIVTSSLLGSGLPAESGYTHGYVFLAVVTAGAIIAALFIPGTPQVPDEPGEHHMSHAELAAIAGGTVTEG
jgi:MFS family permease